MLVHTRKGDVQHSSNATIYNDVYTGNPFTKTNGKNQDKYF